MDPGIQPPILAVLTQVEEMLISRANPILQVTHAHGGQYNILAILFTSPKTFPILPHTYPI